MTLNSISIQITLATVTLLPGVLLQKIDQSESDPGVHPIKNLEISFQLIFSNLHQKKWKFYSLL